MSFRHGDSPLAEGGCKSARFGQRITVLSDGTITLRPVPSEGGVPSCVRRMRAVQIGVTGVVPPSQVARTDAASAPVVLHLAESCPDMLRSIVPGGELTMETLKMLVSTRQVSKVVSEALKGNFTEVTSVNVVHADYVSNIQGLIQVLFEILPDLPSLTSITISHIEMRKADAQAIANALTPSLQHLDLSQNDIGADNLIAIAQAIPFLPELQVLNLSKTNMAEAGAQAIAKALTPSLQHLNLSQNDEIGEDGFQAIAEAMRFLPKLKVLNLSETNMAEAGAQAIAKALQGTSNLRKLDLSYNQSIGEDTFGLIAEAIKKCKGLELLRLADTDMQTAGAQAIANALLAQETPPLRELDLSFNVEIGDNAFGLIAEAIKKCKGLELLRLSDNNMQTAGAQAIANALTPSLQHLDLSSNRQIGVDGLKAIAKAIPTLTQLKTLNLVHTEMTAAGAQAIANALLAQETPNLQKLDLSWNRSIGEAEQIAIAEAIRSLNTEMETRRFHVFASLK